MTQSSGTISTVFKSRQNLLKLLSQQGYDIKDYEEFSVNETHIMYNNKQLDMMLTSQKEGETKKVYVKYHLAKTLRRENINDYIDDLYNLEQVLTKTDTLVIVIKQEPHDTLLNILNQILEVTNMNFTYCGKEYPFKFSTPDSDSLSQICSKQEINIAALKAVVEDLMCIYDIEDALEAKEDSGEYGGNRVIALDLLIELYKEEEDESKDS